MLLMLDSSHIWEHRSADECACTAYVTFKDAYAVETAVLLSVSSHSTFCKETVNVNLVTWVFDNTDVI